MQAGGRLERVRESFGRGCDVRVNGGESGGAERQRRGCVIIFVIDPGEERFPSSGRNGGGLCSHDQPFVPTARR